MPGGPIGRVTNLLVDILGCLPVEVLSTSNIVDDLGCDSIDLAELQLALEDEFGFVVPNDVNLHTVQEIADYVTPRMTR